MKKNELATKTLPDLVTLVNASVETYLVQQPKYAALSKTLLDEVSSKEMIDVMDIATKLKTLEIANKNMLSPIESLTKLVQAITALKEREDSVSSKETFDALAKEMKDAKKEYNKARAITSLVEEDLEEVEILDEE